MTGPLPKMIVMIVITMKRKKASHQSSDQRTCDTGEPTKGSQTWKEPLSQDTEKVIFCEIRKTLLSICFKYPWKTPKAQASSCVFEIFCSLNYC